MVIVRGVRKVRNLPARHALPRTPRIEVTRERRPYWREHGWVQSDGHHVGYYQVGPLRFAGRVNGQGREFLIHHPPRELRRHPHWVCFHYQGDGWYSLHFSTKPGDVSSGIMTIERMLSEALGSSRPIRRRFYEVLDRVRETRRGSTGSWWRGLFS